jgi:hypothetical protein
MAEVVQQTRQEFWQPPTALMASEGVVDDLGPTMAEVCPSCGTEFLLGSHFCHSCGRQRPEALSAEDKANAAEMAGLWEDAVAWVRSGVVALGRAWKEIRLPAWVRYLTFHEIQSWVGLPTASLIAFTVGLACIAGALLVGLLTAKTLVEWQAIQYYRAEWLLGATAAFVAGILLKKPSGN